MSFINTLTKQRIGAMVTVDLDRTGHNRVTINFLRRDERENGWRGTLETTVNGWFIDSLNVTAWWSNEYPELNFGSMFDSIHYGRSSKVTISNVEAMHSTLKRIHNRFDKITATDGYTDSFGEYVLRVCKIMGVKTFLIPRFHKACSYDQMELHEVTAAEFRDYLNNTNKTDK